MFVQQTKALDFCLKFSCCFPDRMLIVSASLFPLCDCLSIKFNLIVEYYLVFSLQGEKFSSKYIRRKNEPHQHRIMPLASAPLAYKNPIRKCND